MQKDDRITEDETVADSDMQPTELPSASIEANPLLAEVKSFNCLYKGKERCSYECAYCERLRW